MSRCLVAPAGGSGGGGRQLHHPPGRSATLGCAGGPGRPVPALAAMQTGQDTFFDTPQGLAHLQHRVALVGKLLAAVFGIAQGLQAVLELVRGCPERLWAPDALLGLACLEKDPDQRPQTARALVERLARCTDVGTWGRAEAQAWWTEHGPALTRRSSAAAVDVLAPTVAVDLDRDRGTA